MRPSLAIRAPRSDAHPEVDPVAARAVGPAIVAPAAGRGARCCAEPAG